MARILIGARGLRPRKEVRTFRTMDTLANGLPYRELGETYVNQIDQRRTTANLKHRLARLDDIVTPQRDCGYLSPRRSIFMRAGC